MNWNYRVVKRKLAENEESFDVCEVYYDENGKPISYALNKNVLSQDSVDVLHWVHKEIEKAFKKPILEDIQGNLIEMQRLLEEQNQ